LTKVDDFKTEFMYKSTDCFAPVFFSGQMQPGIGNYDSFFKNHTVSATSAGFMCKKLIPFAF